MLGPNWRGHLIGHRFGRLLRRQRNSEFRWKHEPSYCRVRRRRRRGPGRCGWLGWVQRWRWRKCRRHCQRGWDHEHWRYHERRWLQVDWWHHRHRWIYSYWRHDQSASNTSASGTSAAFRRRQRSLKSPRSPAALLGDDGWDLSRGVGFSRKRGCSRPMPTVLKLRGHYRSTRCSSPMGTCPG